jgi:DNA invertase Pin-like site-specific DNA recombinase
MTNSKKKLENLLRSGVTRCAIYTRSCSATADVNSVAEQIRKCTGYAEKRGWDVAQEFVRTDIGASGIPLTECNSLMHLLEAAQEERRPFDCVLIADISRLGRSLDRVIKLVNALHGRGVFVQAVRGEFDSRNFHPGAWAAKDFVNCAPQYSRSTARQCPLCGR